MKTQTLLKVLAVSAVATGITLITTLCMNAAVKLVAGNLFELLHFMPTWLIRFVGAMNVLTYLPIFIIGISTLGTDGAIGKADKLRTWSIYQYLRNPMYAGLSFSLMGLGCLLGLTGMAAAGLIWLFICFLVTLGEERSLIKRFGQEYVEYKMSTPRFVPEFEILFRDLRQKIFHLKETKY